MDRPRMNQQKVEQCMKRGKSRKECMAQAYPEGNGKSGKGKSSSRKKTGGKQPPRFARKEY